MQPSREVNQDRRNPTLRHRRHPERSEGSPIGSNSLHGLRLSATKPKNFTLHHSCHPERSEGSLSGSTAFAACGFPPQRRRLTATQARLSGKKQQHPMADKMRRDPSLRFRMTTPLAGIYLSTLPRIVISTGSRAPCGWSGETCCFRRNAVTLKQTAGFSTTRR